MPKSYIFDNPSAKWTSIWKLKSPRKGSRRGSRKGSKRNLKNRSRRHRSFRKHK